MKLQILSGAAALAATMCVAAPAVSALTPAAFSYNVHAPLDVEVVATHHDTDAVIQEVTFASPDRRRIHAKIVSPIHGSKNPGILFVHWLGDPKTTNLSEFLPDAIELASKGGTSVLVDAMWSSPGWFDTGRKPDTDFADSVHQVVDLRRALDLLLEQPHVDHDHIAYVGHDFGAMYGAVLSGIDRRPRWYVLMAGTTSFSDWYLLGSQPKNKTTYVAQMKQLDPLDYLRQSKADGILFQFALRDRFIPLSAARAFSQAAPASSGTLFYKAGHDLHGRDIAADRLDWLEVRLFGPNTH